MKKEEIKNMQHLRDTIFKKEVELELHKEDIKDDINPWILVKGLFNRRREGSIASGKWDASTYLRSVASHSIKPAGEKEGFLKKLFSFFEGD